MTNETMTVVERNLVACRQNVYRLQRGGQKLCEALRKIADGCDNAKDVALYALNHKEPDPDWSLLTLARQSVGVEANETYFGTPLSELARTAIEKPGRLGNSELKFIGEYILSRFGEKP